MNKTRDELIESLFRSLANKITQLPTPELRLLVIEEVDQYLKTRDEEQMTDFDYWEQTHDEGQRIIESLTRNSNPETQEEHAICHRQ